MIDRGRLFSTARSALRYPELADAPAILGAVTDPLFPEELPIAQLRTIEQIESAIERRHRRWETAAGYSWCAELRSTGQLIGMVGVHREESPGAWSLGYWILPAEWGRGHATEIANEAVRVAFDELGAEQVVAGAALWNVSSQRVLEKLGFRFANENPHGYEIQKRPIPTREYHIGKDRWRALQGASSR
jgi:RimJ/RimL family protein N-acetyltransferase